MDYSDSRDGFQVHHIGPLGLYPTAGLQVKIQSSVNKLTVLQNGFQQIDIYILIIIVLSLELELTLVP